MTMSLSCLALKILEKAVYALKKLKILNLFYLFSSCIFAGYLKDANTKRQALKLSRYKTKEADRKAEEILEMERRKWNGYFSGYKIY